MSELAVSARSPARRRLGARDAGRGASVGIGELLDAHRALAAVDPADPRAGATWRCGPRSARSTRTWPGSRPRSGLLRRRAAAAAADRPGGHRGPPPRRGPGPVAGRARPRGPGRAAAVGRERGRAAARQGLCRVLRPRAGARARAILARVARRGPTRLGRRTRPVARRGTHLDQRATLRAALRHAGEPLERRWRQPVPAPAAAGSGLRRLRIDGALRAHAARLRARLRAGPQALRGVRVQHPAHPDHPRAAEPRPRRRVAPRSRLGRRLVGGTRIGDAIAELNREHGRRLGRGAVVAILSDGWDRGEPELLEAEIERLARCSHRLVWLNPLKATPGYEPLVRGMSAALPHVDLFLAGNTLGSVEQLADCMERGFAARPARRNG